jgi:putative membrane protein
VGFWAYAVLEFVEGRGYSRHRGFSIVFALAVILAVAGLFEMVEWLYAAAADPVAGAEFLGSQGDLWDAQKDMLADGLGAVAACLAYAVIYRGRRPPPLPRTA